MCAAVNSSPPPQVTLSHSALKSAKKCKLQGASNIYLPKNNQCNVIVFLGDNNGTSDTGYPSPGFQILCHEEMSSRHSSFFAKFLMIFQSGAC